jgi:hypothetical protein
MALTRWLQMALTRWIYHPRVGKNVKIGSGWTNTLYQNVGRLVTIVGALQMNSTAGALFLMEEYLEQWKNTWNNGMIRATMEEYLEQWNDSWNNGMIRGKWNDSWNHGMIHGTME